MRWFDAVFGVFFTVCFVILGWIGYRMVETQGYPEGVYLFLIFCGIGLYAGLAGLYAVAGLVLPHLPLITAARGVEKAGEGVKQYGEAKGEQARAERERVRRDTRVRRGRRRRR
jgi:hypothetical protein